MIMKKRLPPLRWRASSPRHILRHARLSDIDAELEQFSMDPRRPHSGLAMLISRISRRISSGTVGLPPRRRDFQRQYDLKPARYQRTMVSGLTIANASQTLGNNRWRPTNINRSMVLKESFFGAARRRTSISCRKVKISASSVVRDRSRSTTVQPISLQNPSCRDRIACFSINCQPDKVCDRDSVLLLGHPPSQQHHSGAGRCRND